MREIWRLLKPGGQLLLTIPYGQAAQTVLLRVYDESRFGLLLDRFEIEQLSFYRREKGCHWLPAEEATMHTVSSVHLTEGVALVRARKLR